MTRTGQDEEKQTRHAIFFAFSVLIYRYEETRRCGLAQKKRTDGIAMVDGRTKCGFGFGLHPFLRN